MPPLEVILRQGKLALATPNAFYSYSDRYRSFAEAFRVWPPEAVLEQLDGNGCVLLLGFGLGSILELLAARGLRPKATGIDLDPRIPELWRRYGTLELQNNTTLVLADAAAWLARNTSGLQQQFDLICVDLFVDDQVPAAFSTPEFMAHLKAALATGGALYWSRLKHESEDAREDFEQSFLNSFPNAESTSTGGNRLWHSAATQVAG